MKELNSYISELKGLAQKYELENIKTQLEDLEKKEDLTVSVALLGEFSSGKSTLINALLGKKVLPATAKPTTKNIVKVIPKQGIESFKFYLETEEGLKEIEPLEFREFAVGEKKGNTVIEVPAGNDLPEGFIFIDTPGISSLDQTDTDITFGYLPFIDGAVICQDVNFGGFTNSVIKFLKENLPEELRNKFIFAITKTDTKPETEVKQIKENAIKILKEEIGYEDAENRVATCAPLKFLKTRNEEYISEFKEVFRNEIIAKKKELVNFRKRKILSDIADLLLKGLSDIKDNNKLDLSDIEEKIKETKQKISDLEKEKETIRERLRELENKLNEKYEKILMSSLPAFKEVSSEEEVEELLDKVSGELEEVTKRRINRFLQNISAKDIKIPELHREIESSIKQLLSIAETVKTALRMLILVALPGGGAMDVAQAGIGYVTSVILDSKAPKHSEKTSKSHRTLGAMKQLLQTLDIPGKIVNFGAKKIIESKLRGEFPKIARELSQEVIYEINDILEEKFEKIDRELSTYNESLSKLYKEKNKKVEEFQNFISALEGDIEKVFLIKGEINEV